MSQTSEQVRAEIVETRDGTKVTLTHRSPFRGMIEGIMGTFEWDSCGNNTSFYNSLDCHPLDLAESVWRRPKP